MKKFLLLLSTAVCLPAQAQVNSHSDFLTLQTPNFRVHHTAPQTALAKKFTRHLEEALPVLQRELAWSPDTPIDIVLNDRSDSANGFAQSFPFNKIEIFPVAYNSDSSLMEYHDWVRELAVHELVHIVANDTSLGWYKPLRWLFGSVIKPNGMQPRWLVEGLAVYMETEYSHQGRGRTAFLESLLRTAAYYKKWDSPDYFRLDRLNDGVFWWPAGAVPYLLGYTIQAHLEGMRAAGTIKVTKPEYGTEEQSIPGMISNENASMVPYFLEGTLENISGIQYQRAWQAMAEKLQQRYAGTDGTVYCALTHAGRYTGSPRMGRDGYLYFIADHPDRGRWLARQKVDAKSNSTADKNCETDIHGTSALADFPDVNFERLVRLYSGGPVQISVSPDGTRVLYTDQERHDTINVYDDIYLYDVSKNESLRLTEKKRARDAVFSADGRYILYVRTLDTVEQAIEELELATGKTRMIYRSRVFDRISGLFLQGDQLYFSYHNNAGQEEIRRLAYSAQNQLEAEPVVRKSNKGRLFFEKHPFVLPDGTVLFAANYSDGKNNARYEIFRYSPGADEPVRISDSHTGMMLWPAQYGNKLYASQAGLAGFNIVQLPQTNQNANTTPRNRPVSSETLHEYIKGGKATRKFLVSLREYDETSTPYSSFSTIASSLWPKYWIPFLGAVDEGFLVGATTGGADALGYHNYTVSIAYDSRAQFPHYYFNYTNKYWRTHLSLTAQQENNYLSGANLSNRAAQYSVAALLPMNYWSLAGGFAFREQSYFGQSSDSPYVFSRLTYSYTRSTPSALAPNSGFSTSLYTSYHIDSTVEDDFAEAKLAASLYLRGLLHSHSIEATVKGGYTSNDLLSSNYYLGGGTSSVATPEFIVRGYPRDSLLGQEIVTGNLAYTLPLKTVYRGLHIYPAFLKSFGATLHADAGAANLTAVYSASTFLGYASQPLFKQILTGVGLDLFAKTTLFYYFPLTVSINAHYGFRAEFGGEALFFFSLGNTGLFNY